MPGNHPPAEPKVSVILHASDHQANIGNAIHCVLTQTHHNWELIVLVDSSQPAIRSRIDSYRNRYPNRIQTIECTGSSAPASLVDPATGKYVAVMAGNDLASPERFEHQVAFLEANPETAAVESCPHTAAIDSSGLHFHDQESVVPVHNLHTRRSVMMRKEQLPAVISGKSRQTATA